MALSLDRLPLPPDHHNIELRSPPRQVNGRQKGFETSAAAEAEDCHRAHALKAYRRSLPDELRPPAKHLRKRLAASGTPRTLASARYYRDLRIRVVGGLLALCERWPRRHLRTFCAIPKGWAVPAEELDQVEPDKLTAQFRAHLIRAGAAAADGFLVAFLDAEFEPNSRTYVFHLHGFVGGGMIAVVDSLRKRPAFKRRPDCAFPLKLASIRRNSERAETFSYALKSFWRSRQVLKGNHEGRSRRQRLSTRIPEPDHIRSLLWKDRVSIGDLAILMKCKVTLTGLALTQAALNQTYMTRKITPPP